MVQVWITYLMEAPLRGLALSFEAFWEFVGGLKRYLKQYPSENILLVQFSQISEVNAWEQRSPLMIFLSLVSVRMRLLFHASKHLRMLLKGSKASRDSPHQPFPSQPSFQSH